MNLAYVINKYLSDPILDELRPSTRYNRKHGLKIVQDKIGHVPVEQIRKSTINKFLAEFISEKGKQANLKSVLKTLESWALDMDMIPYSFMTGVKIAKSKDGHKPWTDKEVETAIEHARPDLARAIILAVNTGQRGSDIVKMRWSDIEERDGRFGISVTQQKTGRKLCVPLTHTFANQIGQWERRAPFFLLLTPNLRPFSRNRLSHDWTNERDSNPELSVHKSGGLVLHGLRATAVVRLWNQGYTQLQISTIIGMSLPMVERYCRLADKNKMAFDAMNERDNVVKLPSNLLKSQ